MNPASTITRFQLDLDAIRSRVDTQLSELFGRTLGESEADDPSTVGLSMLRDVALSGGKRIRPAFAHWAFVAAGGDPDDDRAIEAGSVLELLHTFALVHDDVMDEATTRRAMPTLHVRFAERHAALGMRGSAQRYGENMAILLGDFALLMCTQLAMSLPRRAQSTFYWSATQLMRGQYLDIETAATGQCDSETASRTAMLKTASYTVQGPLLVGAALAPAGAALEPCLRVYGRTIGQAFQHRDDLLDIFGDEKQTGKPVGGDVVNQKATRLVEIVRSRATGVDRALLDRLDEVGIDEVRALLVRSGAVEELEQVIDGLILEATTALADAPMSEAGRTTLIEAAHFVGRRNW